MAEQTRTACPYHPVTAKTDDDDDVGSALACPDWEHPRLPSTIMIKTMMMMVVTIFMKMINMMIWP